MYKITYFAPQFLADHVKYSRKQWGGDVEDKVTHSDTRRSLFHDDLHQGNILVNPDTAELTILDWEGILISPDWLSGHSPLLPGPRRLFRK
jgi:thiamine kinase-like enzyme